MIFGGVVQATFLSALLVAGGSGVVQAAGVKPGAASVMPKAMETISFEQYATSLNATTMHAGALRYGRGNRVAVAGRQRWNSGLQCVPFARADSGIEIVGNANTWWGQAAGIYERGTRPELGSVLNFRGNSAMPMGHVAVVSKVLNPRTVLIEHANWAPGAVSRDVTVIDVSSANNWSAVRVSLGHSTDFGSIYPTYGFIYNRPDSGTMVANASSFEPIPALNPAPRDLRGSARGSDTTYDEVAEAPDTARPTGKASRRKLLYRAR